jgi:outer membrane lipoprotein-sorting protein
MTTKIKHFVILSLTLLLVLTGCSSKANSGNSQNKDIAQAFKDRLAAEIELPELADITESYFPELFEDLYSLSLDDIEDYVIMEPSINFNAWTITMYKMKDSSKTQEGLAGAEHRAERIINSFKDYMPDQYEIAKKYIAIENNGYILIAVGTDAEKAKEIFLDLTK